VEAAVRAVEAAGFVNYYGPQRFGDSRHDVQNYSIGRLLLQQKWAEAVERILQPDSQGPQDVRRAKEHWQSTRDAPATIKLLPPWRHMEAQVLKNLHRYAGEESMYERALMNIPHAMRTMLLHSYCSLLWNTAATARIQTYGLRVVAGDLAMSPTCGPRSDTAPPHVVTAEEAAAGTFAITDVVLPMPGKHSQFPEHEIADVYRRRLEADGVTMDFFARKPVGVPLPGAYRPLIVKPSALQFQWEPKDAPPGGASDTGSRLQLAFTLPRATYATILLRELCKADVTSDPTPDSPPDNDGASE